MLEKYVKKQSSSARDAQHIKEGRAQSLIGYDLLLKQASSHLCLSRQKATRGQTEAAKSGIFCLGLSQLSFSAGAEVKMEYCTVIDTNNLPLAPEICLAS